MTAFIICIRIRSCIYTDTNYKLYFLLESLQYHSINNQKNSNEGLTDSIFFEDIVIEMDLQIMIKRLHEILKRFTI